MKPSPCDLTSKPPYAGRSSRTHAALCTRSSSSQRTSPSRSLSAVDPSMSENRIVTVPSGAAAARRLGRSDGDARRDARRPSCRLAASSWPRLPSTPADAAGQQRRRMTTQADAPAEDRPDRPEVAAAARRPDRDQHHVDHEVHAGVDADARRHAPAAPRRRLRRRLGGQRRGDGRSAVSAARSAGVRAIRALDPLGQVVVAEAPRAVVVAQRWATRSRSASEARNAPPTAPISRPPLGPPPTPSRRR